MEKRNHLHSSVRECLTACVVNGKKNSLANQYFALKGNPQVLNFVAFVCVIQAKLYITKGSSHFEWYFRHSTVTKKLSYQEITAYS